MQLIDYKIERLQELKTVLNKDNESLQTACKSAEIKNKWFTQTNIWQAINAIKIQFLDADKLRNWLNGYNIKPITKKVGIILAGNIPLVGFHDILCAFVLNAPTRVKLSSKDEVLMKFIIQELKRIDITWDAEIIEKLTDYDAVIGTGSNNTNRYFEYYFKKVSHLLRGNRHSIAVINGYETEKELDALADDIFQYFGLGCRNISFVFVPAHYDIKQLFPYFDKYKDYVNHNLYKDNYDYNRTLLLMNKNAHLANDFVIVKEDENIHSRLATVHYKFYENTEEVLDYILDNHKDIQTIVGSTTDEWKSIPFGKAQQPALNDYADNVDTLEFLLKL
ncbi:MAG: acyl-CoA reductase [Chitinophagales bacterium]|nr:acyl-CoA reductase [Chitinophagales bacterium]